MIKKFIKRAEGIPEWAVFAALFAVMAFFLHAGFFTTGANAVFSGDPLIQNYPLKHLLAEAYGNLELPLWDPYEFAGHPLLGSMQSGAFYPVNILLYTLLPVPAAFNVGYLLTYAIAALFTFMYLRLIGLGRGASFLGAVAFGFSGFIRWVNYWHIMISAASAYVPLLIYILERMRRSPRVLHASLMALAVAVQISAGNFQMCVYTYLLLGFFVIYHLPGMPKGERLKFAGLAALGLIAGLIIASPQIAATYELASQSFMRMRQGMLGFEYYSRGHFNIAELPSVIFPKLFAGWGYDEHHGTVQPALVFLTALVTALLLARKSRAVLFWAVVALISFLLAAGPATPLHSAMYHLPIYNQFRMVGRHMLEFTFAASVLFAIGLDSMLSAGKEARKLSIGLTIACAGSVALAYAGIALLMQLPQPALASWLGQMKFEGPEILKTALSFKNPAISEVALVLAAACLAAVPLIIGKRGFYLLPLPALILITLLMPYKGFITGAASGPKDGLPNLCTLEQTTKAAGTDWHGEYREVKAYPPVEIGDGFNPMSQLTCSRGSVTGMNPLSIDTYNAMLDLGLNGYYSLTWEHQLKNNLKLSMLGGRYVAVSKRLGVNRFAKNQAPRKEAPALERISFRPAGESTNRTEVPLSSWMLRNGASKDGGAFALSSTANGGPAEMVQNIRLAPGTYEFCAEAWAEDAGGSLAAYLYEPPAYTQIEALFISPNAIGGDRQRHCQIVHLDTPAGMYIMSFTSSSKSTIMASNITVTRLSPYLPPKMTGTAASRPYEKIAEDEQAVLYLNHNALPKAWFVQRLLAEDSMEAIVTAFDSLSVNPARTAFVPTADAEVLDPSYGPGGSAKVVSRTLNTLTLRTSSRSEGFLVVSEQYYPGWKASVDGRAATIHKVNGILRGVVVPVGEHTVAFRYSPGRIYAFGALSLITASAMVAAAWLTRRRRRGTGPS